MTAGVFTSLLRPPQAFDAATAWRCQPPGWRPGSPRRCAPCAWARGGTAFVQAVGEDEAGNLPSCWFYLAGLEGRFQSGRVKSSLSLEATDTRVDFTQHGFCGPNTAYNNSHFAQGYTHSGVVLGAPIDSEGTSLVLYGEHEFAPFDPSWSIGAYRINDAAQAENRLSSIRVEGEIVSLILSRAWNHLEMDVYIAHQGFDLNSAGLAQGFRLGLGARVAF